MSDFNITNGLNTKHNNLITILNECMTELNLPHLSIKMDELNCNCQHCNNILNAIYNSLLSNRGIVCDIKLDCNQCKDNKCIDQIKLICDSYVTYLQRNNFCTLCSRILGINNPRQLCGKTYCLEDYSDDSE